MISSDDIEQQDEMISSAEKDLNFKKLRMKLVFFLTLMIVLLLVVTIGVLIFYPRVVVENNHNSDNEDVKQMILSLLNKTDTDRISSTLSDNEDIEQTISSRLTRFITDNDHISLTLFKYNNTNCPYQFPLYDDDRRISVCSNSTVIDIRQFVNDVPSIKGLNLSKNDWIKLVSLIPYVNAAMLL